LYVISRSSSNSSADDVCDGVWTAAVAVVRRQKLHLPVAYFVALLRSATL
jgi:hypothetical protein